MIKSVVWDWNGTLFADVSAYQEEPRIEGKITEF